MPEDRAATGPPEERGLARDEVRLAVAARGRPVRHVRFTDVPAALAPGDLVVVNTSTTAAAAVEGTRAGHPVVLHVSGPVPDGDEYVVELRAPDGGRVTDAAPGQRIALPRGVTATLVAAHPDPAARRSRLWRARVPVEGGLPAWLARVGRPIRYSHLRSTPPIEAYRTVFAQAAAEFPSAEFPNAEFPSAEMPSAGRPFSPRVLAALRARGVGVVTSTLHTGVSSPEVGEAPLPERYTVPAPTAAAVNATRARGGRIVAVGTTVTRALETVAAPDGTVRPGAGWTDLVLGPQRPARTVGGLVTGWHEPEASHLQLLEAVAGRRLVRRAYRDALAEGYLWHEFGDVCLLLP
ncbi:MAG: S-adenosylmethionine:tRNA ribosyltransferase-isomerase [Pseudonocardia sp.]